MNSGRLNGKVALVTGGSRGIGAAIVTRLASEGARVAFTYVSSKENSEALAESIKADGGVALPIRADSGNEEALRSAFALTVKTFGPLGIFVNNAAVMKRALVDQMPLQDVDLSYAVNVRAVIVGIQECCKTMAEGGRIVTIGSIAARKTSSPGASIYGMTKSALAGLVRGVAVDLAPRGITINNIDPGPIATGNNPLDNPRVQAMVNGMPMKRLGNPDEVAGFVAFLASADNSLATGSSFLVDGAFLA